MEIHQLIPPLFGAAMAVMGWFLRQLWDATRELKADLARLREELPRQFVLREDYRADIAEIKALLREVREAIAEKADK